MPICKCCIDEVGGGLKVEKDQAKEEDEKDSKVQTLNFDNPLVLGISDLPGPDNQVTIACECDRLYPNDCDDSFELDDFDDLALGCIARRRSRTPRRAIAVIAPPPQRVVLRDFMIDSVVAAAAARVTLFLHSIGCQAA